MAKYTVEDDKGKRVTFDWSGDQPPSDDDIQSVFDASATFKPIEKPKGNGIQMPIPQLETRRFMEEINKPVLPGIAEGITSTLTGGLASIPAGLTSLVSAPFVGLNRAEEYQNKVANALTMQPK